MERQQRVGSRVPAKRVAAWVLSGVLMVAVGGTVPRPAPAAPGFGRNNDSDRDKERGDQERRAEERRQQERSQQERRAEEQRRQERGDQERRAEERRQQERSRDAERQAERQAERARQEQRDGERRAQERARQEKVEAERARQADQERAQRTQQERTRQADQERARQAERAAREAERARQMERARQAERERPRAGFGRKETDTDTERARRDAERVRQEQQREAERQIERVREAERAARETAARETRAREEQRRSTGQAERERSRPGFGRKDADRSADPERQAERDRQTRERARQEQQRESERARERESERARERGNEGTRESARREAENRAERERAAGEARSRAEQERAGREARDRAERERSYREGVRRPGFGLKDENRAERDGSRDRYLNPRGGNIGYRPDRERDRRRDSHYAYRDEFRRHRSYDRIYRDDNRYRYDRRYRRDRYDDCPYDVIFIPVPGPVVIRDRVETEVIRIPEPVVTSVPESSLEPESPESPSERLARVSTLDEVIGDVEEAWLTGNLQLLMQHVRRDRSLEVFREGEFLSELSWEQFREKTSEAFQQYDTVAMRFAAPRMLSDTEAVVSAEHRYREDGKEPKRVRVVYALVKENGTWWIAGLDYLRLEPERKAASVRPAVARPAAARTTYSLAGAPRRRWATLRTGSRPVLLATVKVATGDRRGLYDLKAMRGVRPGTLAWSLYRRGQSRPVESGTLDSQPFHRSAWVVVQIRPSSAIDPNARTLRALTPAGRSLAFANIPLRSLGEQVSIVLREVPAPRRLSKPRSKRVRITEKLASNRVKIVEKTR